jgi:carnitine O-palmitoyltransferase 2
MSQYGSLFNTTRIPKINKDSLFQNESAKHMVVLKGGNFYIFDVFDKDGKLYVSTMTKMDFFNDTHNRTSYT